MKQIRYCIKKIYKYKNYRNYWVRYKSLKFKFLNPFFAYFILNENMIISCENVCIFSTNAVSLNNLSTQLNKWNNVYINWCIRIYTNDHVVNTVIKLVTAWVLDVNTALHGRSYLFSYFIKHYIFILIKIKNNYLHSDFYTYRAFS